MNGWRILYPNPFTKLSARPILSFNQVVLVVDYSRIFPELCAVILEEPLPQVEVLFAHTREAAITKLNLLRVDLVIAGQETPDHNDGLAMGQVFKSLTTRAKIVVTSDLEDELTMERVRAAGADRLLRRPFEPNQLVVMVGELLGLKPTARE